MNYYSKPFFFFFWAFLMILSPIKIYAQDNYFDQIIFFGDSLSDNGNLYYDDMGYMPKSPPYYQGRFSNGPVWADLVAKYFYDQSEMVSENFATGGETAVFHNPMGHYLPYTLSESVDSYIVRTVFTDRSHTLFVLWLGSNDYLSGSNDIKTLTDEVTQSIQYNIERLIGRGGTNFLVINLPDFAKIPFGNKSDSDTAKNLTALEKTHNQKLAKMMTEIQKNYKGINIHIFDLGTYFDNLLAHVDEINKKYQIHLTNLYDACWQGGYSLRQMQADGTVSKNMHAQIKMETQLQANKNLNADFLIPYVIRSPALLEAYRISELAKEGEVPCANPDEYVFWDQVHPTAIVHKILGDAMVEYINQNYHQVK